MANESATNVGRKRTSCEYSYACAQIKHTIQVIILLFEVIYQTGGIVAGLVV
jgi:hypothetical protein